MRWMPGPGSLEHPAWELCGPLSWMSTAWRESASSYRAYKSGSLVSDDEVALTFDPFSYAPTSEPLVNIRFNLDLACGKGIISGIPGRSSFWPHAVSTFPIELTRAC